MRVNKNIVIDPDTSSFVLRAFNLYSQGNISLDFLRNKMLEDGFIYTDTSRKIGKSQLEKMLKNPFYAGKFLYKNVLYTGRHEPLISIEMFNNTAKAFKKDNKPDQCRSHIFNEIDNLPDNFNDEVLYVREFDRKYRDFDILVGRFQNFAM